jgi:protein-disulfide isomerase
MVENWKIVIGILLVMVVLVVVSALGLSSAANKDRVNNDELTDGASWETLVGEPKVTVVVFSDLQCPACREGEKVAKELRRMEGVKFVFRHFPLMTIHKNARPAALVLEAAKKMGKGWEMMEILFDRQSEWSEISVEEFNNMVLGYIEGLGLNVSEFDQMMKSSDLGYQVQVDEILGEKLKLSGTPTFYVNGRVVATSLVLNEVKKLLN